MTIKSEHKKCNVLGRYCWDHKVKTEAGIPGWTRPLKGPGVGYSIWESNEVTGLGYTETITWLNGDRDTRRNLYKTCFVCNKHCANPVSEGVTNNSDGYYQINKSMIK